MNIILEAIHSQLMETLENKCSNNKIRDMVSDGYKRYLIGLYSSKISNCKFLDTKEIAELKNEIIVKELDFWSDKNEDSIIDMLYHDKALDDLMAMAEKINRVSELARESGFRANDPEGYSYLEDKITTLYMQVKKWNCNYANIYLKSGIDKLDYIYGRGKYVDKHGDRLTNKTLNKIVIEKSSLEGR